MSSSSLNIGTLPGGVPGGPGGSELHGGGWADQRGLAHPPHLRVRGLAAAAALAGRHAAGVQPPAAAQPRRRGLPGAALRWHRGGEPQSF